MFEIAPFVVGPAGKVCAACGEFKPFTEFTPYANRSGFRRNCKPCRANELREYNKAHPSTRKRPPTDDETRTKWREYRKNNAERRKAYNRQWEKANPEKVRAQEARHRAKLVGVTGTFTKADIDAIRVAQGNRCYICHKKLTKYHIDHFIPLAKGGTNDPGNLRLACPRCNTSKQDKHPHDLGILI
jgi:5-methylcytosine-specific restriction endonuclease McrA